MTPEQEIEKAQVWAEVDIREPDFWPMHDVAGNYAAVREIVLGGSLGWKGVHERFTPKPGSLVMDVGANAGIYTAYCAIKGARVVAFEPFFEVYSLMANMITKAGLRSRVSYMPAAVWTHSGQCRYFGNISTLEGASAYNGGIPSESLQPGETAQSVTVPCYSFEQALSISIDASWDCVKMDIEGSECEVLNATPDEALKKIKFMYVEFHPWTDYVLYQNAIAKLQTVFHFEGIAPMGERFEAAYCTRRD